MNPEAHNNQSFDILSGGGQAGELMRSIDWSQTSVGAVVSWPSSLKNIVRLALDNASPMYISWGKECTQFYNSAYLPIFGEELFTSGMGKNTKSSFPEMWRYIKPMWSQVQKGSSKAYDNLMFPINKNGYLEECFFTFSSSPLRDESGEIAGVIVIANENTERVISERKAIKQVEMSEERYRSFVDTIPQLVWTTTPEGTIDYANERCLQYTGIRTQGKYSANWFQVIHPLDRPSVIRSWNMSFKYGKAFKEEYRIKRHDGEYRWFLGRSIPVKNVNGEILYWNGTATDIEEHKRIENELEKAIEIAENANATKSSFLANMSHEIRTPLGAILGFSELLKTTNLDSQLRDQYIETICRNGESLTRIIDDILDLAKVEAGKLEIEHMDFSLTNLLQEVFDLLKQKASQKNITLSMTVDENVPRFIYSDPTRLRQIFINIIGNAVKFTDDGSVSLHVKSRNCDDGTLQFFVEVTDTGRGLDEEQKNRLFVPFTQADNTTTRQYGGTGLGLALSRRLSEALGGNITIAKFEKGKGCTFIISFVAMLGEACMDKKEKISEFFCPPKNLPLKGMNVLFVDDCVDNQFLVEHFLSLNGAHVTLAGDGREAVDKALAGKYDLVLMDIQMPNMDGYQATQVLMNRGYKAPIIALTAHAMSEEREKTKAMGFSGHLTKPFNFNELLQKVTCHRSMETTFKIGNYDLEKSC